MEGGRGDVEIGKAGFLKKCADAVFDILFPRECLGCGAEDTYLCNVCSGRLPLFTEARCPSCKGFSASGEVHPSCRKFSMLDGVLAGAPYNEWMVRRLIATLKYQSISELALPLSELMARKVREHPFFLEEDWTLVSVPLHRRRFAERGFNQAELFCEHLVRLVGLQKVNALVRHTSRPPQATLGKEDRRMNIKHIFEADAVSVRHKKILLVDDVYTTGATMNECARMLKGAGAREVWGLVAAMT